MNGMPEECWLIKDLAIGILNYKDDETEEWETWEWYLALRDDIEENGLVCPILVDMVPGPYNRFGEWGVRAGHHRLGACLSLGWDTIPVLIYGTGIPPDTRPYPKYVEHVPSLIRVHEILRDGRVKLEHEMFWMSGATLPETGEYPQTAAPYWPANRS